MPTQGNKSPHPVDADRRHPGNSIQRRRHSGHHGLDLLLDGRDFPTPPAPVKRAHARLAYRVEADDLAQQQISAMLDDEEFEEVLREYVVPAKGWIRLS
jgi:hypothetical protein